MNSLKLNFFTAVFSTAYWKTGTRGPSGILANPLKNPRKPGPMTLVAPYKKPENRAPGPLRNQKTGTLKTKTQYHIWAGKAVPNVTPSKPLQLYV